MNKRTQVGIIGSGPAGLLLAHQLRLAGIDSVIVERQSRVHVEARVRAGVLEQGTADLVRTLGVGARMDQEGLLHDGFALAFSGRSLRIDLRGLTGKPVTIYGQTELTRDLIAAQLAQGGAIHYDAPALAIEEPDGTQPRIVFEQDGARHTLHCDFVAGCDGFHGAARKSVPESAFTVFEKTYPFGWLGILADVPPCDHELIYANHARGFALCSMRSPTRSRYYVQCALDDRVENWTDDAFWDELRRRLPPEAAERVTTGPRLEMSIAPLRSYVSEPLRFGRLFLAGDAAHIVPPTGAKGLNLAASDAIYLARALIAHYREGSDALLDAYSQTALARVWKAIRFSWWFTTMMHRFPDDPIGGKMYLAELDYLAASSAARTVMAENYVGLPI
jgi:p-hydroxybenzoate 3-monooxygenase